MNVLRATVPAVLVVLAACGSTKSEDPPSGSTVTNPDGTPVATVEHTLKTTPFVIEPGAEVFKCFYTTLAVDAETAVARFESNMTRGSHHMILFGLDKPGGPDGTLGECNLRPSGGSVPLPLFVAQEPHQEATFPSGVAMPLKAKQPVAVQMHYLNAGVSPVTAEVEIKFHALPTGTKFERAGVFGSFHNKISVPARGTQTVSGRCQVPSDVKFISLTTHSHRYTTRAVAGRTAPDENSVPQLLVETLDYERPPITKFPAPFLDLAGDKIFYSCEYRNDTDQTVTVGDSAVNEEMCMAVGYYFPAAGTTVCLGSTSITL